MHVDVYACVYIHIYRYISVFYFCSHYIYIYNITTLANRLKTSLNNHFKQLRITLQNRLNNLSEREWGSDANSC